MPDAEVTAGLAELETMGAAVVAAANAGNASTADVDAMFDKWATFEGTIKQNEVDLYLTMEDSLAGLRAAAEKNDGPGATTVHEGPVRRRRRLPGRASVTRLRALLVLVAVAVGLGLLAPGRASAAGVTREDAIAELQSVRVSIDETLDLFRAGHDAEALGQGPQRLPQPLRVRRDPAAGGRPDPDGRGRVALRRDPPARPERRAGRARSATSSSSCAASSTTSSAASPRPAPAPRPSSPGSRSSSSSARASRSCCSCRCCSATSSRPRPAHFRRPILMGVGAGRAGHRRHRHRAADGVRRRARQPRAARGDHRAPRRRSCCSTCRSG